MKKRNFAVHFEREQLQRLILDENSCVTLKQCTHHLALHPYHLNNIKESLKYTLNKGIAKYDKTLGGIVLGYENLVLLPSSGAIVTDTCFIHVDIAADFYLFRPEVGKSLTGVVTKKSADHVGCLVYEAFNVSIPKPTADDEWMGSTVEIGQEILFQITFMNLEGRLPYIRGFLISILTQADSGISTEEDQNNSKSTKKKTKAKKIVFNSNTEGEGDSVVNKKKRKRKHSEEISTYEDSAEPVEEMAEPVEETSFNDIDETYVENRKKSKRRKIKTEIIDTSYDNLDISKKKKKYHIEVNTAQTAESVPSNISEEFVEERKTVKKTKRNIKKEIVDTSYEFLVNSPLLRSSINDSLDQKKIKKLVKKEK